MALPLKRSLGALAVAAAGAAILLTGPAPGYATAGSVVGTVDSGVPLKVRAGASTDTAPVAVLRPGSRATVTCQVTGQWIHGKVRVTNQWDRLTDGRYVSDAYVRRDAGVRVPACTAAGTAAAATGAPVPAAAGVSGTWVAPVPGRPGQGFRPPNNPNHQGVDIMEPRNTAIRAASGGVVITVTCNTSGPSCDIDGSPQTRGCGWYLEVQHASGVITRYCHLIRQPSVVVGQPVVAGQVLGFIGTSGNSSAPHLHFEVHRGDAPANPLNAVDPVAFMRAVGAPLGGAG